MKPQNTVERIELSIFKNAKSLDAHSISVAEVIAPIRSGDKGLKAKTDKCRQLAELGDKQAYRKYKAQELPAVTFGCAMITRASGVAPDGQLLSKNAMKDVKGARALEEHERIKSFTHLVILDFDDVDVADVMAQLSQDPHVMLVYISPSGDGVKAVVLVTAVTSAAEYKRAWTACAEHFSHIGSVDISGSDVTRLCFLAHHELPYYNQMPTPLDWRVYDTEPDTNTTTYEKSNVDVSALNFIPCDVYDSQGHRTDNEIDIDRGMCYKVWIEVGMACHHAGLDISVWEAWSQKGQFYEPEVCSEKWTSFSQDKENPITWASVVRRAKRFGYVPKGNSQKKKKQKPKKPESPFFDGRLFLPLPVADALKKDMHFLALSNEKGLRVYRNGRYILDDCGIVAAQMRLLLGDTYKQAYYDETFKVLRGMHLESVSVDSDPCLHPEYVNVKNGLLHVTTGQFKEHSPAFYSTTQLPVVYDPKATCPAIDTFLFDVLNGNKDDIQLAIEFIGYSMLMQVPLGKMLILYGPTHTGKSTFLELLKAFIGAENCAGLSLQSLDDESHRFSRAGLVGKLINISSDLSARHLSGDSNIKKIISGDSFSVERKGVDPFPFSPYTTLISACNELPISRDKSDAWLERLIILPFFKQHTGVKAKRNYIRELTTPQELSGLLNHAVGGVKRILETGVFTETETTKKTLNQYKLHNDNVHRFVSECYEVVNPSNPDAIEYEKDLYTKYTQWCGNEGEKSVSKTAMQKSLKRLLGYNVTRLQRNGKRVWAWKGLIFSSILR